MKRVVELLRVSTVGQAAEDRASIPSQRAINRRTAEAYGLTIVRSIEMAGVSGAMVLLAPEMQEMIRLMHDPEIHGVVTREFSRLMRPENYSDYALLQVFADTNTLLYLPEGPINFSSMDGRLMGMMKATIGGLERLELQRKIWDAREIKRKRGELGGCHNILPFGVGYPWRYTADAERVKEAFKLLLAGDTAYTSIGRKVGIEPYNLRVILRNPIYTGWRVIDKKRDLTAAGKYKTKGGRQGDRRKVKRASEEVIRVRIKELEPLISEADFNRAQAILDLKRANHWRADRGYEHRFTYHGYLQCECGSLVYTKYRRDDYYICRDKCGAHYMRKDRLEPALDRLFAERLSKPQFLKRHILAPMERKTHSVDKSERLRDQLDALERKRQRVLDAFFDGVIDLSERDEKILAVAKERSAIAGMLERERPAPQLNAKALAEVFQPFIGFDVLSREDKRQLLNVLAPSITVKDYEVSGISIAHSCGDDVSLTDTGFLITASSRRIYLKFRYAA